MKIMYAKGTLKPKRWVRRWMPWLVLYPITLVGYLIDAFRFAAEEVRDEVDQFDWTRK